MAVTELAVRETGSTRAAPNVAPLLSVDGVTLQYKTRQHLVTATYRVGFNVFPADRFVLLGPSGCGKSTLLKGVAGFMTPVEGTMRLNGRVIDRPGPDRMMVFQEFDQLLRVEDGAAERHVPDARQRPLQPCRGIRARPEIHRQGQPHEIPRRLSAHAVGRHEAARRDRPRDGDGAGHPADGRAVRGPRRADAPQDAGGAAAALGRYALHDAVRHPLDRGGDHRRLAHPGAQPASGPREGRAQCPRVRPCRAGRRRISWR